MRKCTPENEKMFPRKWENVPHKMRKCTPQNEEMYPQNEEMYPQNEEMYPTKWGDVPTQWGNVPHKMRKCTPNSFKKVLNMLESGNVQIPSTPSPFTISTADLFYTLMMISINSALRVTPGVDFFCFCFWLWQCYVKWLGGWYDLSYAYKGSVPALYTSPALHYQVGEIFKYHDHIWIISKI